MPFPIESNNFIKGGQDASTLLLEFLNSNRKNSYNVHELVDVIASIGRVITTGEVEKLLEGLEYAGKVESQIINSKVWFARRDALKPV